MRKAATVKSIALAVLFVGISISILAAPMTDTYPGMYEDLSDKDKRNLAKGKVVVWSDGELDNGMSRYSGAVILDHSADKVWGLLTDFEEWPKFLPSYVKANVIEETDTAATVEFTIRYKRLNGRIVEKLSLNRDEFIISGEVIESQFNISKADQTATLEFGRRKYTLKSLDENSTLLEVSTELKFSGVAGGSEIKWDHRNALAILKRHMNAIRKRISKLD